MIRKVLYVLLIISLFILNVQYVPSASAEENCPAKFKTIYTVYQAGDFCVYVPSVNELEIIKYIGNETDLEIPDTLKILGVDMTVRNIGVNAFVNKGLTSVKIPKSVQWIGDTAFANNNLNQVVFKGGSENNIRLGVMIFYNNPLKKIIFNETTNVESIISVTSSFYMGDYFITWYTDEDYREPVNWGDQTSYTFSAGTTIYTQYQVNISFDGNGANGEGPVTIVTKTGKTITLPQKGNFNYSGHRFIGWNTKPDGTGETYKPRSSFKADIKNVTFYAQWVPSSYPDFYVEENEDGTLTVKEYYGNDKNLEIPSIIDGKTVTNIGEGTFQGKGVETVTIPDSITSIGKNAFSGNELTEVTIPSSVEEIGDYAFTGNKLKKVKFIGAVSKIAKNAFDNMEPAEKFKGWFTDESFATPWTQQVSSAMEIYSKWEVDVLFHANGADGEVPKKITKLSGESFIIPGQGNLEKNGYGFAGWNTKAEGTGITYQPEDTLIVGQEDITLYAMWKIVRFEDFELEENEDGSVTIKKYDGTEKGIVIPNSIYGRQVTAISDFVFYNKGLTSVKIPDSVTSIGYGAFAENQLTNVEIPSSVKEIGDFSFINNPLKTVTFKGAVTTIKPYAFYAMSPKSKFIGWYTDDKFKNSWDEKTVQGKMTVYSKWHVQISFNGNGALKGQVQAIKSESGESIKLPSQGSLEKKGYGFVGWNTEKDGTGKTYKPGNTFTAGQEDVTLYAEWNPIAKAVKASDVKITNTTKQDTITLKGLTKNLKYTIYKDAKLTKKLKEFTAPGSTYSFKVNQIGAKKGVVYIVTSGDGYVNSQAVKVSFKGEPTPALSSKNVKVTNAKKQDTIKLKGLRKGTTYVIYTDAKLKKKIASFKATGTAKTIKVKQLGKKGGTIYIIAQAPDYEKSTVTKVKVPKEKK